MRIQKKEIHIRCSRNDAPVSDGEMQSLCRNCHGLRDHRFFAPIPLLSFEFAGLLGGGEVSASLESVSTES